MQNIKEYVTIKKNKFKNEIKNYPNLHIAIIQIGDVDASNRYVKNKIADCEQCGIICSHFKFSDNITEEQLLTVIHKLNNDSGITGFIVQFPLPEHIHEETIMKAIDPKKDLDGFNLISKTLPATPFGIYNYLKDMHFTFRGKNAVILGRSDIVGKPMAKLLLNEDMNVTVLHSKTAEKDKQYYLANADLIIVATGHINTLTHLYNYKNSAFIFDVGINVNENGKLCGDCEDNLPVAFQSPVPGGCGLLTRLALIENAVTLLK